MEITEVTLIKSSGKWNEESGKTYSQTYHVYFTGMYSIGTLLNQNGSDSLLPAVGDSGDTWVDDDDVVCTDIGGDIDDNSPPTGTSDLPSFAVFDATFAEVDNEFEPNPLNDPPRIQWGGSDLSEVTTKDKDGAPIVNSAEDLYDPLPPQPIQGGEVTITWNIDENPADIVVEYSNTTNESTWHGVAAGNGLIGKITASNARTRNGIEYWELSVPILFNRRGWRFKPIDNGFRELIGSVRMSVTDASGAPVNVPVLLNGAGAELAIGGTAVVFPTDGYKLMDETNWSTISIPNPFA